VHSTHFFFSSSIWHHDSGDTDVDLSIQTESPITFTYENVKSIALTISEIFTNLLAEDTKEEIIILKTFWSI
jgi:hypothetical protein